MQGGNTSEVFSLGQSFGCLLKCLQRYIYFLLKLFLRIVSQSSRCGEPKTHLPTLQSPGMTPEEAGLAQNLSYQDLKGENKFWSVTPAAVGSEICPLWCHTRLKSLKWNCLKMASRPSSSFHPTALRFGSSWSLSSALSLWALPA